MTLFHYCSTDAFYNMIAKRSIWLSSLSASNDTQEGRWLSHTLARACRKSGMKPDEVSHITMLFRALESVMDCYGFCLSTKRDMLSQWRGYANDATGFSIGFTDSFIEALTPKPKANSVPWGPHLRAIEVVYDEDKQQDLVLARLGPIIDLIEKGAVKIPNRLTSTDYDQDVTRMILLNEELKTELFSLADLMFVTKNPAFEEEKEWRLIGQTDRRYLNCKFRSRGNAIIPYKEVEFPTPIEDAVESVTIGPRNQTSVNVLLGFLHSAGLSKTEIRTSRATYR